MKGRAIKVLIADDHDLIRQGLRRVLSFEEDMEIAAEASNGREVLDLLKRHEVDVILLDCNMPLLNGIQVLESVRKQDENVKVIMLTVENDRKVLYTAINIGADGYILKDSAGAEIVNAIRTVHNGEKYLDESLVSILFSDIKARSNKQKEPGILDALSKREIEVLLKISKGLSNKAIGQQLFLSEKTIKNYASNLFRKINVQDRVQATILALENNIEEYYMNKYCT